MIYSLKLCLKNRPTCPECERPTFWLLDGWRKHTQGDGLWTEAGYVRYRCAEHRERTPKDDACYTCALLGRDSCDGHDFTDLLTAEKVERGQRPYRANALFALVAASRELDVTHGS